MIEHHLDTENGILRIQPKSSLEKADFEGLAKTVDPFIAEAGDLAGREIRDYSDLAARAHAAGAFVIVAADVLGNFGAQVCNIDVAVATLE